MIKRIMLSMLVALVVLGAKAELEQKTTEYTITFREHHYATFSKPENSISIEIPDGLVAYKMLGEANFIEKNNTEECDFKIKLEPIPLTDGKVTSQQYSAMILYSATLVDYTIKVVTEEDVQVRPRKAASSSFGCYSFDNMLIPGITGMTTEEIMANMEIADEVRELDNAILGEQPITRAAVDPQHTAENYYYKLTTKNSQNFGFYWGAEHGNAFTTSNNKAYLTIRNYIINGEPAPGVKTRVRLIDETGFLSTDGATGIELIPVGDAPEVEIEEGNTYDLLGRKVTTTLPGHIYIKNGKKYIK